MNPANPYLNALMPVVALIALVVVARYYIRIKKQWNEQQNLQDRIKEQEKISRDRANEILAECEGKGESRFGNSYVDSNGVWFFPDEGFDPYMQTR